MSSKECARCFAPKRATVIGAFGYMNTRYTIPLCDKHAADFDREMIAWLRLATEVETTPEPVEVSMAAPVAPPVQAPAHVPHMKPLRLLVPFQEPREVLLDEPPLLPAPAREISAKAMEYTFSTHAEERLAERGISRRGVYELIGSANKTRIPDGQGRFIYRNDKLHIVVDESSKRIITVAWSREREELSA